MTGSDAELLTDSVSEVKPNSGGIPKSVRIITTILVSAAALASVVGLATVVQQPKGMVTGSTGEIVNADMVDVQWKIKENTCIRGTAEGFGGNGAELPEKLAKELCAINRFCTGISCGRNDRGYYVCTMRAGRDRPPQRNGYTSWIKVPIWDDRGDNLG